MADIRLSARARADLLAIYEFTEEKFGVYQADAYLSGLERIFSLLADFPLIGRDASVLRTGFRRFRFQAHIVFYSQDVGGLLIRAVVHGSRNIGPEAFD